MSCKLCSTQGRLVSVGIGIPEKVSICDTCTIYMTVSNGNEALQFNLNETTGLLVAIDKKNKSIRLDMLNAESETNTSTSLITPEHYAGDLTFEDALIWLAKIKIYADKFKHMRAFS